MTTQNQSQSALLDGTVLLTQPKIGFRAGSDTVFVAAFCPAKSHDVVLDIGCGVGGAGLCLHSRVPDIENLYGIEIDPDYAQLAAKNYVDNGLSDSNVNNADIRDYILSLNNKCDQIVCNPPYLPMNKHAPSPNTSKARAMGQGEGDATPEDWVKASLYYLKNGGTLTLIQRADMLDKMLVLLHKAFGAIEVLPLISKPSSLECKRVLIRAIKGRKTPMTLHAPVIVHNEDGEYTKGINAVLRHKQALPIQT